jgi:hypothetical protein
MAIAEAAAPRGLMYVSSGTNSRAALAGPRMKYSEAAVFELESDFTGAFTARAVRRPTGRRHTDAIATPGRAGFCVRARRTKGQFLGAGVTERVAVGSRCTAVAGFADRSVGRAGARIRAAQANVAHHVAEARAPGAGATNTLAADAREPILDVAVSPTRNICQVDGRLAFEATTIIVGPACTHAVFAYFGAARGTTHVQAGNSGSSHRGAFPFILASAPRGHRAHEYAIARLPFHPRTRWQCAANVGETRVRSRLVEANRGGRWALGRERLSRGSFTTGAVEGTGFYAAAGFQAVAEGFDECVGEPLLRILVGGRTFRFRRTASEAKDACDQNYPAVPPQLLRSHRGEE